MVMTTATSSILLLLMFAVLAAGGRINISRKLESSNSGDGMCKLVETQGYSCEEHKVTTKDGYILSMQRIPAGRSGVGKKKGPKPPVLLQHGILAVDGTIWVDMPPDEALGFILADNGFDVWLANIRGTEYSRGHTSLSPNDPEYWEWSWDELAAYDLPAMVGHVYSQTGQKLHYLGHSLGTLMAFGAFSRHEVLDMVRSAAMLSPVAYMGQIPSPPVRVSADIFLANTLYWLGLRKIDPSEGTPPKLLVDLCIKIECSNLMNSMNSISVIRKGTIEMYDYGNAWDNMKHYGEATPPAYNVASIPHKLPLFLSYGGKDLLADSNDVKTLVGALSGHDPDKLVVQYIEDYAHLDFVYGVNAKQLVYNPIMAFFRLN